MYSNDLSEASRAYAYLNGDCQEQDDSSRQEDSRRGQVKTSNTSPMMIAAGLAFAAGATYLFSRVIRSLLEVPQDPQTSSGSASRQPDRQLATVDHFNQLPDEQLREFQICVVENLRVLGFTEKGSGDDIFAGFTREQIRRSINANFKKQALELHPDKCAGREDAFRKVVSAKDDLMKRLIGPGQS